MVPVRVVFMGTPEFAVPCLRALAEHHEVALVVCQPDKPAGRGGQLAAPAVKVTAVNLGLPVIQPRSARTGELRDALKASDAELAVVVAYGKILPKDVLEALRRFAVRPGERHVWILLQDAGTPQRAGGSRSRISNAVRCARTWLIR